MSNQDDRQVVVLHYDKPRYDGGVEIDLASYLQFPELRSLTAAYGYRHPVAHTMAPDVLQALRHQQSLPHPAPASPNPAPSNVQNQPTAKQRRHIKAMQALLQGPLEIAVSLAGIVTTILAFMTFTLCRNELLLQQSKVLLKDCTRMMLKGLGNTLLGPTKALKTAVCG
ncbi:MAG: hypothetical protein SFZ03_08460 [Candidatus Melainabacteria bacterium]|nr:hypothetical protein [Candidatus Melainabacteria bacterium]